MANSSPSTINLQCADANTLKKSGAGYRWPLRMLIMAAAIVSFPSSSISAPTQAATGAKNVIQGEVEENRALDGASDGSARLSGQVASMIETSPDSKISHKQRIKLEIYRDWMEKAHPGFALSTERNILNGRISQPSNRSILVVSGACGTFAPMQDFGFNFTETLPESLAKRKFSLDGYRVMIINCPGQVPKAAIPRIREFVEQGGYLLTMDEDLNNVVSKAFPGLIECYGKTGGKAKVYDAEMADPDPVLANTTVSNSWWQLPPGCQLARILHPDSVRVIARSDKLFREDPQGGGALALLFPFGQGYVLHLVGRFVSVSDHLGGIGTAGLALSATAYGMPLGMPMLFYAVNHPILPDPAPVIKIPLRQAIGANFIFAGLSGTRIPLPQTCSGSSNEEISASSLAEKSLD